MSFVIVYFLELETVWWVGSKSSGERRTWTFRSIVLKQLLLCSASGFVCKKGAFLVVCVFSIKETKEGDVLFGLGLSRAAHRHICSFFTAIRAPLFLTNIPIYTTFHPNSLFRPWQGPRYSAQRTTFDCFTRIHLLTLLKPERTPIRTLRPSETKS